MKKIRIYIGLVLLMHSASYSAADKISLLNGTSRHQKQPNTPQEEPEPNLDGLVEVSFKIDGAGKVQILTINSTSPQLADYVIKKLGKVKLEQGSTQTGKVIKYSFVFKKQA